MSALKPILFLLTLSVIISCSNETYDESDDPDIDVTDPDPVPDPLNYTPSTLGDYWIYDVESTSADTPTMNFTGTDSLYIATSTASAFTYQVNNGMDALGTMNALLVNGSLSNSATTLKYTGTLDIPLDIPLTQMPAINNLTVLDLDAANGDVLSDLSDSFSETLNIQGNMVPIEISYALSTTKENFYPTTSVNGMTYTNVYEATLKLNISVTGTVVIFGTSQTINVIQPQDVLTVRYYYGGDIGLLRAETTQEFQLSNEVIALIQQLGATGTVTTSSSTTSVEELKSYMVN
ncbi:hypothetical protein OAD49_00690 [Flavobacteriaceae bacterium]|nr:hypothetical protein [Flavobacteriaceae bacterium]